jgi:hypothetical protein
MVVICNHCKGDITAQVLNANDKAVAMYIQSKADRAKVVHKKYRDRKKAKKEAEKKKKQLELVVEHVESGKEAEPAQVVVEN